MKIATVIVFIFLSLTGLSGQTQPENVPTRVGSNATVEYVANQMAWQRMYFEAEIRSIRDAVEKVDKITTTRFENVNEWREQSKDREQKFITRGEIWTGFGGIVAMLFMLMNYIKRSNNEKIIGK